MLQVGEVWDEISRELTLERVRPVTPDMEALDTIAQMTEDTAKRVIAEQASLLERQADTDIHEEKAMYTEVKDHIALPAMFVRVMLLERDGNTVHFNDKCVAAS